MFFNAVHRGTLPLPSVSCISIHACISIWHMSCISMTHISDDMYFCLHATNSIMKYTSLRMSFFPHHGSVAFASMTDLSMYTYTYPYGQLTMRKRTLMVSQLHIGTRCHQNRYTSYRNVCRCTFPLANANSLTAFLSPVRYIYIHRKDI